jgi:glycosyltransferase involved in cell wall biosynthesis
MRLLYLTFDDLAVPFAWSVHVRAVVDGLAARGHEIRLVCPRGDAPGVRASVAALAPGRYEHLFGSLRTFVREGRDSGADAVYVRGIHLSTTPARAAARLDRPLVVEVNGLLEFETRSAWRRALVRSAHRATLARAARVVTVSNRLKESLAEDYAYPPDRIDVVPNGADLARFRPGDRLEARRRLGLTADRPIVVCAASFYPHHRRDLLEEAARKAGAFLVLVGAEGPSTPDRRCEGRVPHERVPEYLAAADLCAYVLDAPHPRFGFSPLKLFEYFAAGRAVVAATNLAEIRDLVASRGAGEAVLPEAGALAEALRRLIADPAGREEAGRRGRAAAEAEFSWERSVDGVETSLREAVRGYNSDR